MKRRNLRLVGVALLLTLALIAGCGAPKPAQPQQGAQSGQGAQAPAGPITAVFSNIAETSTLDPAVAFSSDGILFVRNVYEGLLEYVPGGTEVRPALATEWKVSDDGLTYTFKLRQGVTFHDGAPFDANAARAGLERIRKVNQGPASLMSNIKDIRVVDPSTVEITLKQKDVFFLYRVPKMPIVSPKAVKENAGPDGLAKDWFATHAAGTGPYMLKEWIKNNRIDLVKYDKYWRPFEPGTPERVVLRVDPDTSTALQLLGKGDIDMLGAIGPDEAKAAEKMPGVKLVKQPMFEVKQIVLNTSAGPMKDKKVRQAIKYAFDYQAMVDFFGAGNATVPKGFLPGNVPGAATNLPEPRQDLDKAKKLLAEASYPNGGLTVKYLGLKGLSYFEFAGTVLQDSLAKVGIKVEQVLVPWPQMPPMMAKEATAPEMSFLNMSMFVNDPSQLLRTAYYSKNVASSGGYNWSYYRNPKIDEWIDQVGTISDENKRNELLGKAQEVLAEDVPTIPVVQPLLAQPVREQWEVKYETLDYNYVVRFFFARKK